MDKELQLDFFVHSFNNFNNTNKFYAIKILEELIIKSSLHINNIYLIFDNYKMATVRSTLEDLEKCQLVTMNDIGTKKVYSITESGEKLVMQYYNNFITL